MSEEIRMDWSRFEAALTRRLATSSRDHLLLLSEQARGIQRWVIDITPPGTDGVRGTTRAARQVGMNAIAGDIRQLYGTPSDAFKLILDQNAKAAAAFWIAHSQRDRAEANRILQGATGKRISSFDGGVVHERHRRKQGGRVRRARPLIYVEDEKELAAYIKKRQKKSQFLQAGWKASAAKLGIPLPTTISQHSAPGSAVVEVSATRIRIVAVNGVAYASDTDLERRIQWAINAQAGAMERQWDDWQQKLNRKAGL